jgi:hypothetical protein
MAFYFGTQGNLRSVKVPTTGLERTSNSFRAAGVLTNGGGWARSSVANHSTWNMNWDYLNSEEYGDIREVYESQNLIHFLSPDAMVRNALPPYIAQAGDAALGGYRLVGYTSTTVVEEVSTIATGVTTGPTRTVRYSGITGATRKSIWLPIPPGHTLHLRGLTSSSGGVQVTVGGVPLPLWSSGTTIPFISIPSPAAHGAALTLSAGSAITIRWLQAKVLPTGQAVTWTEGWKPGLGHSGCRLDGDPTYTLYSSPQALDYGALSLPLRETGAWE